MAIATISYRDYDGEVGSISINLGVVDGTNYDTVKANMQTLITSLGNIGLGNLASWTITDTTFVSRAKSTDVNADRERKFLLVCEDTSAELAVGVPNPSYRKTFTHEFPAADYALRNGNDEIVWTDPDADPAAVKAAVDNFTAIAKSPTGGNLNVLEVRSVSRNT